MSDRSSKRDATNARLYQECHAPLYAYVNAWLKHPQTSKDIVQEVFASYLKKPRPHVNSQKAYLFTIAYNLIIEHLARKDVAHVTNLGFDGLSSPEVEKHLLTNPTPDVEDAIDRESAMRLLPRLLLHPMTLVLKGMRNNEIAKRLGVDPVTVRRQLRKACNVLKIRLERKRSTRRRNDH